jgi:hypothetical protein
MSNAQNNNRFSVRALIFTSSPNGETTAASSFYLNLYLFAAWRNNNHFSVLPESLTLRRIGEISTAPLSLPESFSLRRMAKHQPLLCFTRIFNSSP